MFLGIKLFPHERMHFLPILCKGLLETLYDVITDITIQFMSVNSNISSKLLHLYDSSFHFLLYVCKFIDWIWICFFLLGNFEYFIKKMTMSLRILLEIVKKKCFKILFAVDSAFDFSCHIFYDQLVS